MPHLLLQALKSSLASRPLDEPLGPSPLSYATVAALFPPPPPPSYIDWIRALENDLLGGSANGVNSRPDLFLPAHAVVLVAAFLVILMWYGEIFGQKNKAKRRVSLSKVPQHDCSAKARASKCSPFPNRPSQQAKKVENIKEKIVTIEDLREREQRDEWCSQVYAGVIASLGAVKEETEMETEIEKELGEVMASAGSQLNFWLASRPPSDLTASPPNSLLLLACLLQNKHLVAHKKSTFSPDITSVGSDIPDLSDDMPELGENECCDISDIIYLSSN